MRIGRLHDKLFHTRRHQGAGEVLRLQQFERNAIVSVQPLMVLSGLLRLVQRDAVNDVMHGEFNKPYDFVFPVFPDRVINDHPDVRPEWIVPVDRHDLTDPFVVEKDMASFRIEGDFFQKGLYDIGVESGLLKSGD